jgi:hypothetical protein
MKTIRGTVFSIVYLFSFFTINAKETYKKSNIFPGIKKTFAPRATFDKLWVDYDITEGGQKGMRIHIKFTTYDMLNLDAYLAIYFEYDDEVGGTLKDKNKSYYSTEGDVAVYKSIKPQYNPAVYDDLQVFMPYSELDLDPGTFDLTMDVKLIYKEGGSIQHLTYYNFEYTKPGINGENPASSATASFDKIWVDYDVTENGLKGMRIHVKFSVFHMKDVDSYLAIYFEKKDGEKLKTTNTNYRSKSGQVATYKSLNPGYDPETVYEDLQLFMPYNELNLGTGRFDLKMDLDVIYKNGGLIKHLNYYDFWFSQ